MSKTPSYRVYLKRNVRRALFVLLEDVTINLRDLYGQQLADRAKYAELIMKACSGKKTLQCSDGCAVPLEDVEDC